MLLRTGCRIPRVRLENRCQPEYRGHRDQAELRQLVAPVEGGERGRGDEHQYRAGGEQQPRGACFPVLFFPGHDESAGGQHETGREDRPGQVEPAPVARQERGQARPQPRRRVAERGDRGVGLPVGPDRGAELQVGGRVLLRPCAAGRREPVAEVTGDGFGVGERLVPQDSQAEVPHHRVPGHPGRGVESPLRRLRVPGVEVRVAQRGRLGGAERLFVGGQAQPLAGGEVRDPAVEERAAERGEVPLPVRGVEPAEIAGHRNGEAAGERRQPFQPAPPWPGRHKHVEHGRDDHDQVLVPERHRQPEQQPGDGRRDPAALFFLPPDQDGQGGHDHQDGPGVGQHVLLEHQLQRVEQHRDGGGGREPPPHAEADEHRVDQHGRGQPGQVLRKRDDPQRVQQRHRDDQDGVPALPQGVGTPLPGGEVVRVLQVPHAVREDQRRMVSQEHHGPQRRRKHEQGREHPMPACFGAEGQLEGVRGAGGGIVRPQAHPDHRWTVTAITGPVGGACRYCQ